jgi:hypothetical protein
MPLFSSLDEPARTTTLAWRGDLAIVGGSCTGVFAAVRAARLGLSVALVEQNVILGGMATAAQVNEWHSLRDTRHEKSTIGGLTVELVERLRKRGVLIESPPGHRTQFRFNSAELAAELNDLVVSHRIRVFLAARAVAAVRTAGHVDAVVIEDRNGRRGIAATCFIDASGDGDLLRRAGFEATQTAPLQPTTLQALVGGVAPHVRNGEGSALWQRIKIKAFAEGYPTNNSTPWWGVYPGIPELTNIYGPRVGGIDASDADQYTTALFAGRKNIRRLVDALNNELGPVVAIAAWSHALGVRQTWHARCHYRLTGDDLMTGRHFHDSIGQGTYPIDIHHDGGTWLRYLDGREEIVKPDGTHEWRRWRSSPVPCRATAGCFWVSAS